MITKLYSNTLKFIKNNVTYILFIILFVVLMNIPLPYKINTSGELLNLNEKVSIDNSYSSIGSLNLTYVSEIKGNVLTVIVSKFNDEWDLVKDEDDDGNISDLGSKILLNTSLNNAISTSYKYLNKELKVIDTKIYVIYVDDNSNTNLEVGDVIEEINGNKISSTGDIRNIIKDSNIGDTLKIKLENGKEKYARVKEDDGLKNISVYLVSDDTYDTDISFNFKPSELGSSCGLMVALSIYDKLTSDDITKGRVIAGTGTIDKDGNVGEIGGIKYKIKGAKNADIFLVPSDNYEEAEKVVKENNYDIELISVNTFNDAVKYLSE